MPNKSSSPWRSLRRRLAIEVLALAVAAVVTAVAAAARPWTLTDAAEAPHGRRAVFTNGAIALVEIDRTDMAKNSFATQYERVTVATGAATPLPETLNHPRWSPDSKRIAWIDLSGGGSLLVVTDAYGGHRRVLRTGGGDVRNFAWSPDGRTIAAIEAPHQTSPGGRLFWLTAETDYRGTQPPSRSLWIVDVASGTQREITRDSWSYGGPETDHDPSWSPDGSRVAVVRQPTPVYGNFEHAQYVTVNLSDGTVTQIVNHPFFAYPGSAAPAYGPGNAIAYTHTWDGNLASREDVFVDGRDVSAPLDRDLWSCSNTVDGVARGVLTMTLLDGVAIRLYALDPSGATGPRALTPDDGSVVAYSIANDGTIAYIWTTGQRLPELFVRTPNGQTRQVTSLCASSHAVCDRTFTWNDAAGHTLHGLLTLPSPGSASSAPLIVEPHGGPQCADPSGFNGAAQYLASNGYAYFRPDPPGSDGYGDWSYKAIVGN